MNRDKLTKMELENLEEAAMTGDVEAQLELGIYYEDSDSKEALKWFKKAANGGSNDAALKAADILMFNDELKNEDMAIKFYQRASEQGDIRAMYELAWAYIWGDNDEGYELMKKCADQKSADACFYIARRIEFGERGFGTDFKEALRYYELAIEYGEADGGYSLALIYAEGKRIPQDKNKARDYAKKAKEIKENLFSLVKIYYMTGDLDEEIQCAKKFVAQNPDNTFSNYYYARALMRSSKSVDQKAAPKAYATARKLLEAKEDKIGWEYFFLAEIYKNGYGVAADEEKAKELYLKAAENGVSEAADEYSMLNKNLQKAENFLEYDIDMHKRESYMLYGTKFSLERDLEYYAFCKKAAAMLAAACKFYYEEQYNFRVKDVKDFISTIPEIMQCLNELVTQGCCNWLSSKFQISVGEHEFYEKYLREYIENDFVEPYSQILEKVLKTELGNAKYDTFMKSVNFYGNWITASDGSVSGNLKAMGSTILLNAGTDIAFEALKSVSTALGSLWKDIKLSLLFDQPSTKNAYLDIFDGKYSEHVVKGLLAELKKAGIISELYFPEFDGEKYFKKCNLESKDRGQKNLVFAIINDPFELRYYDFALTHYGDENGELEFLAEKFDVNLQGIKEGLSKEFYEKHCQSLQDYDKNRELFVQLLNHIHYQESPELKLFDTRMSEDNEQMELLADEEQKRKTEYIDVLCAILEVTFNIGNKKHYKNLKEGGKQFVEFICISETFGFDAIYTKQFKKMNAASGDAVIKAVRKGKKSYYRLFTDYMLNDDHTHLEELAEKGFVWAYRAYAYTIREENPIKALVLYDAGRSFANVSDLATPEWVEKIVEKQNDEPSVKEWTQRNAKRCINDKPYFVFEGQKKIKHSLTSEEVYGMVNENSVSSAIDKFYSDMENGADIRYFSDIMKDLKKKYQKYCIEKIGNKETIGIWLRRPLLKEIWEKIGDHEVVEYRLCFRVNGIDDDFEDFLNLVGKQNKNKPFVFGSNEVLLVVLAHIKNYYSERSLVITDKKIYMYASSAPHDIITIELASISKAEYNFLGDFVITQNDGTVIKLERNNMNESDFKNYTGKLKPVIDLIKNYDFLKTLPKLSVADLREMKTLLDERFPDVDEAKNYKDSIDKILRDKELYTERKAYIEELCDGLSKFDYNKCQKVHKELMDYDAPDDMKKYYLKELNDRISFYKETDKWDAMFKDVKDDDLDGLNNLYETLLGSPVRNDVFRNMREKILKKYSDVYGEKYKENFRKATDFISVPDFSWIGGYLGGTHTAITADSAYKRATGKEYLKEITIAVWDIDKLTAKVTTIMAHQNVYIVVKNKLYTFARKDSVLVQAVQRMMSAEITVCAAGQRITFAGMDKEYADKYNAFMQFMYKIASDNADSSSNIKKEIESNPASTNICDTLPELTEEKLENSEVTEKITVDPNDMEAVVADIGRRSSVDPQIKQSSAFAFNGMQKFDLLKNKALSQIRLREPDKEIVLFIHDNTLLGSCKAGTVITNKYVYAIKKDQCLSLYLVQNVSESPMRLCFKTHFGDVFETKCDTIDKESKVSLIKYLNELVQSLNSQETDM